MSILKLLSQNQKRWDGMNCVHVEVVKSTRNAACDETTIRSCLTKAVKESFLGEVAALYKCEWFERDVQGEIKKRINRKQTWHYI